MLNTSGEQGGHVCVCVCEPDTDDVNSLGASMLFDVRPMEFLSVGVPKQP